MSDMIETEEFSEGIPLEEAYLKGLYEAYEIFREDYRTLHKRSKMHDKETIGDYYLRWKDKMLEEIRNMENLVAYRNKSGIKNEELGIYQNHEIYKVIIQSIPNF